LEIEFMPCKQAYETGFEGMQRRLPDTSKTETIIGNQPRVNLRQMLEHMIAFQRDAVPR
jgi:hypothetical protein